MNVSAVAVRACHRGTRNAYTNLCTVTETKEENAQVKYSCKTGTLNGTKCITQLLMQKQIIVVKKVI